MGHYVHSGLSPREEFNINGRLSRQTVEQMLDDRDAVDLDAAASELDDALTSLKEGGGCFPGEDFLSDLIRDMNALKKSLRGNNRSLLDDMITQTEQLQTEVFQTTEYGRDELDKSQKSLNLAIGKLNT